MKRTDAAAAYEAEEPSVLDVAMVLEDVVADFSEAVRSDPGSAEVFVGAVSKLLVRLDEVIGTCREVQP